MASSTATTPASKHWYKSTFPNEMQSLQYHWQKHGQSFGNTMDEYTNDALTFFAHNKHLGQNITLKDGSSGILIRSGKGQPGGYFTSQGQIVTFWYQ